MDDEPIAERLSAIWAGCVQLFFGLVLLQWGLWILLIGLALLAFGLFFAYIFFKVIFFH